MKYIMFSDEYKRIIEFAKEKGIYPDIYKIEGASTNPEITVVMKSGEKKKLLMFSSNNYLGLANDERIKKALIQAAEKYGMGSGGSRLVSGNIDIQEELESAIAKFKGYESAITFSTGYMANTGTIPALLNPLKISAAEIIKNVLKDVLKIKESAVFSDELNHASIVDACKLAKSKRIIYKHKSLEDLESKLKKYKYKRKLIVTDGVFSMDGDIAPLSGIMDLAEKYNSAVMVDDAHSTGILGDNGVGTTEYFHLEKKPEIMMGTFTKSFGAVGGFVAASKDIIDYLRVSARSYIFSAPIPPLVVAGILESLRIIKEDRPFEKLKENIDYLTSKLKNSGFNILETETQIIPIIIGDERKTIQVSRELIDNGIFAPAVMWPAVPRGLGRLRITLMSSHSKENLDYFFNVLLKAKEKYKF
jgi:8-amino-7-oxononanoate synthase